MGTSQVMSAALICAVLSAICWVALDVTRKELVTSLDRAAILAWLSAASMPFYLGWWWLMPPTPTDLAIWLGPGLGVLACNVIAGLLFLKALSLAGFSASIPFLCLGPACTICAAWIWLGETPSSFQLAGLGTVTLGAALLIWDAHATNDAQASQDPGTPSHIWGALAMTTVAALWSMSATLDKLALQGMGAPLHAVIEIGGVAICMALVVIVTRRVEHARPDARATRWIALGAVTGAAALGLQLLAIQGMYVGAVDTLKRALGVVASLVIGASVYGERVTPRKICAAMLMATGAALILWP